MMKVKIEKLVFGGAGLGHMDDGRVVFVWNALPCEEVEFELIKKEKTHWEGMATKILNPSPVRLAPKEAHYLSCSPWQIMTPEEENKWKIEMAKETYQKIGGFDCELELAGNDVDWGYRNKMEYSFAETVNHLTPDPSPCKGEGNIMLSFFERGKKVRQCIEACELANPEINRVAKVILSWINKNKIPMRSLKAMILRSNLKNEVIAALFIKDKLEFKDFIKEYVDIVFANQDEVKALFNKESDEEAAPLLFSKCPIALFKSSLCSLRKLYLSFTSLYSSITSSSMPPMTERLFFSFSY